MKFAKRLRHSAVSPSVALAARVRELRARGVDIINFGTRPDVPQHVKRAAVECFDSDASAACTDVRGRPELRQAIADKLVRENALEVDAADLRERITPATRALLLCNPHNPTGAVHDEHSLIPVSSSNVPSLMGRRASTRNSSTPSASYS